MAIYEVQFETSLPELDVVLWFENNVTHERDDFRLRYLSGGCYRSVVDGVVDRDLIRDNPDFDVFALHTGEDDED